ncbi:MaoC/PaaZ C-terminal domain-containing protein [Rhodococcus sp. B10]|uniref:MaoC/PaaZ C-terminal domain-containing protein n=1 Tax=Rhodococcus sp. B10 TaxID=2695876 RepID=UPI001431DB35|nr:MaoC/PaaZ C-terminal domain-containing protein [Rhodococcus sp. B10]NIL77883.1 Mesaconyl-C(4)-CoA hydratase [Rhodococcus sp. B10]
MTQNDTVEAIELAKYADGWTPDTVETTDVVHLERLVQLARTLDLDESRFTDGTAPILGHWTAFQDWPPTSELGLDGHPAEGHFYPPIPDRRRMFAGSTITAHEDLRIDTPTLRRSSVESVTPKRGKTGEMLFVVVRHDFEQAGRLCRTEQQQIVYRSDSGGPTRKFEKATTQVEPSNDSNWATTRSVPPPTLFRYSALTANAHRIHYDTPYATGVEGYPGLVVHGPLLATLMADLVGRAWGDSRVAQFSFRLAHPLFANELFVVEGSAAEDGQSAVLKVTGSVAAAASATAVRR